MWVSVRVSVSVRVTVSVSVRVQPEARHRPLVQGDVELVALAYGLQVLLGCDGRVLEH